MRSVYFRGGACVYCGVMCNVRRVFLLIVCVQFYKDVLTLGELAKLGEL